MYFVASARHLWHPEVTNGASSMQHSSRVAYAQTLRGYAAICVLISHYYGIFWGNPKAVGDLINAPEAAVTVPAYLTWLHVVPQFNWGAFGVALFFLISGFVIPFSLSRQGAGAFLVGRFFRIVPLYMVGFTISLAAIGATTLYFVRSWPFSPSSVAIHYVPGLRDILWSRNIDGIVWTLEIEMKFYVICALFAVWFRRTSLVVFVAPVILLAMCIWLGATPASQNYPIALAAMLSGPYLIYMFIGVAFHYAHVGRINPQQMTFLVGALFLIHVVALNGTIFNSMLPGAWSYGAALIVFAFAASFPVLFRATKIGEFFANISYPLYVVHGVAGYAALRLLIDKGASPLSALIVVTAAALGLSWLLHVTVETRSDRWGKQLIQRWKARWEKEIPVELAPAE